MDTLLFRKKAVKNNHYCIVCKKYLLTSVKQLRSHLRGHGLKKPILHCKMCDKKYFRTFSYLKHLANHENDKICETKIEKPNGRKLTKNSFICCFCHETYPKEHILNMHIMNEHYEFNEKEKNNIFTRAINETWIEQVNKLNIFVEIKKINNNVITIRKHNTGTIRPKIKQNKRLKKGICDYCNKTMWKKSLIKHIEECHFYIYKYKCKKCLNSYKRKYMLANHECGKPVLYRRPRNPIIIE